MTHRPVPWSLHAAVVVETLTVAVLLINLATAHVAWVASAVGPLHGTAYLTVVVLLLASPAATTRAKWLSAVPVVGGWLALRELRQTSAH